MILNRDTLSRGVNLENDDAFSFFVEPSVSGNDVFFGQGKAH